MALFLSLLVLGLHATASLAIGCPYMTGELQPRQDSSKDAAQATDEFMSQFEINDADQFLTSDVGGPISDQTSLKAGERGPTLLEDFIFRQKITHFDHERVPERAVHARGAGAHGVFESYADWSNITAASFLGAAGKQTPVFIRFSTVAGSRGSSDTVRDVHGFATRLYTDEGNFDIVGNNIPVFFIQDAIQFPDLIHSVKPEPASEIPQAATAHNTAYDFFSQQPSTMHTLFWAMTSGYGISRGYRHMDGFGVHTFRFVTDDGSTKLVKFHWKTQQGKAGIAWEEAQAIAGKNADFHRQDLFESIEAGNFPEWELAVQIMNEEDQLRFGFDLLDPTKIVPEELVPLTPLGKLTLNRNPANYFAETEQIMFQPGHIVRGVDFTDDPLLQGRIFSYLDTQLNRNGGPNFEQLPINRPRVPVHNNNRDGAGQMFIPLNEAAYSPNTMSKGSPKQANQTQGKGFFTAPNRQPQGKFVRAVSSTFADVFSQPRLFFNSLLPQEQQMLINGFRFELSQIGSEVVKQNMLIQLNRISNNIAVRVASTLGMTAPAADPTFYHDNKTAGISVFNSTLKKLDGLRVGFLTTLNSSRHSNMESLRSALAAEKVNLIVVAERLTPGVNQTYSAADAIGFDGIIADVAAASLGLFSPTFLSSEFPAGRPAQIMLDGYRWGKVVGGIGLTNSSSLATTLGLTSGPGVVMAASADSNFASAILDGLRKFRFLERFALD